MKRSRETVRTIATRRLRLRRTGQAVHVSLGIPEVDPDSPHRDWPALQKELQRTERIVYCQHVGESGEKLYQAAEQLGLEGVIGKKADSPYRAGRTPNWVKVKTSHGRHVDEER